ncbi:hypothetical protein GCM10009838_62000 [Catenulispora subtropica]|uniref:Uncharacterized protein n=1 Tax=Catenulispora subtropica TaxID=450798 RepID=A0ABN2SPR0_9ACTN
MYAGPLGTVVAIPGRRPRPQGPRAYRSPDRSRTAPGLAELDPSLVELGRKALAGLAEDGVSPTRDALRARMGVGNGKASAVWTYLRYSRERSGGGVPAGTPLFESTDPQVP